MLKPESRPARLQYLTNNFRVLVDGDYVTCAGTGARIPLEELRYWSAARQEAYATAEAATAALAPQ
ncbi:DUF2093 domain-containing protein [Sphingomonas sp. 2R-10]|uniref:DUF2093 domain-containing protein n=1 Tax=Sphingomonas sp. 2R-10 TaxID=3045148 RepID=UPI000F7A6F50|nr:DUF2093 domain-containing protein [Sphingomonas sp. 2R-10]MDJ0275565.1 DUF2093 domain-containing protein [Sphingomonas sp. 2R-10]